MGEISSAAGTSTVAMRTKLAFGIGASGEAATNWIFNALTFFFYNQVLGLAPYLAGMAVFIAIIFDAITDPVMGSISDRFHSRWGRRHPFMFAAPAPIVIAMYMIFSPPEALEGYGLFAWYTFFTVMMRGSLTLFTVPHLALGAELSDDYHERSKVMSHNNIFTYFGWMVLHIFVWFVIFPNFELGQRNQDAYFPIVIYCMALVTICILVSAWFTRDRIPYLKQPPDDGEKISLIRLFKDMKEAMSNPNYLHLLIGLFFLSMMIGTHETLSIYMATFYWELTPIQIGWLVLNNVLGYTVGFAVTAKLHRRYDKRATIVGSAVMLSIFWSSAVTLRLFGLAPENTTWELVAFIVGLGTFSSIGGSIINISVMSALADIADEHELKSGRRQEGIFYSARTFFAKASNGVGHVVAGFALELIEFPTNAVPGEVDADKIFSLGIVDGPFAMVWGLVAAGLYGRYKINKSYHDDIMRQLQARKEAGGYQPSAATADDPPAGTAEPA